MRRKIIITAIAVVTFFIGLGIGLAGHSGSTAATPQPTVTVTAPGSPVAGPTVTVTASPPAPSTGQVIGKWSGSGNEHTPEFTPPDSGNYVVSWQYSGNVDTSFGDSQATNFTIENTNSDAFGSSLPNDIAASGHGSTEITGADGPDSFNVQSASGCKWTITVTGA